MATYIALLRAINVGKRQLPMADLKVILADTGCTDIVTYIASGNVAFQHKARSVDKLRIELEAAIEKGAGFAVPVVVRTKAQLEAVVEHNPYPTDDHKLLHVVFFDEAPPKGAFDDVDLEAVAPEEFFVRGAEVYLHLPNGMGRAELPKAMGKPLAAGTARNWRTVLKLLDMANA